MRAPRRFNYCLPGHLCLAGVLAPRHPEERLPNMSNVFIWQLIACPQFSSALGTSANWPNTGASAAAAWSCTEIIQPGLRRAELRLLLRVGSSPHLAAHHESTAGAVDVSRAPAALTGPAVDS